jgi:hypothetical protein
MKHLILALVLVAACSKSKHSPPPCSGAKTSHVEIMRVDENSPYMQQVFAHVGSDRKTGEPSDPAAQAAGVRAEVDQWSHDDQTADGMPNGGKRFTDYYLTAPDRKTLESYVAGLGPTFTPPSDRKLVYEPVTVKDKHYYRSYYVNTPALLDDAAFASAELVTDPNTTRPMVLVNMTDAGARTWETVSGANVGHKLATVVDGEVVIAPIIQAPIRGGRAAISVSSPDEANVLLEHLGCPHS